MLMHVWVAKTHRVMDTQSKSVGYYPIYLGQREWAGFFPNSNYRARFRYCSNLICFIIIYLKYIKKKKKKTMDAFALIRENWSLMFIDL